MTSKSEKDKLFAAFVLLPFVIAAAFEWGGGWIGWPALVVGGLPWLGVCVQIGRLPPDD